MAGEDLATDGVELGGGDARGGRGEHRVACLGDGPPGHSQAGQVVFVVDGHPSPYRSSAGELVRRERPQDAELVALRIGEDDPRDVVALADVDASRRGLEAGDLGLLVVGRRSRCSRFLTSSTPDEEQESGTPSARRRSSRRLGSS